MVDVYILTIDMINTNMNTYIVYIHHYPYYQPYRLHILSSDFDIQKLPVESLEVTRLALASRVPFRGREDTGFVGRIKVHVYLYTYMNGWFVDF